MFAHPRPKKSVLPSLGKKRKFTPKIEEISFDEHERADYLTGFHKRKVQRIKHAQEVAAEKARQERIELRREMRLARLRHVEDHARTVARLLREAEAAGRVDSEVLCGEDWDEDGGVGEWSGIPDAEEEEYVDDDKFTTVTVESVAVSRDGIHPVVGLEESEGEGEEGARIGGGHDLKVAADGRPSELMKKQKKKKRVFRYENKLERRGEEMKSRMRKAKKKQSRLKGNI